MSRPLTLDIPGLMALISLLVGGTIPMRAESAPPKPKAEPVLMEEMTMTEVRDRPRGVRVFFSGDSYAKADAEVETYLKAHGFPPSNHGGVADTSEIWTVSAAYVRPDKIAMGDPVNRDARGAVIGPTGVEGDPRRSSPALGKIFDDIKVKDGVDEIRRLIAAASAR